MISINCQAFGQKVSVYKVEVTSYVNVTKFKIKKSPFKRDIEILVNRCLFPCYL